MWGLGALIGGVAGYTVYYDAWGIGAVAGAVVGWLLGRRASRRLADIERRLDVLDTRLAAIEGLTQPGEVQAETLRRPRPRRPSGSGPLGLGAGWVPHRLVFAARGAEPFQLAYGRHDARPAAFPIATLVPGYKGEEDLELRRGAAPSGLGIGEAQAAATPRTLGGKAAMRGRVDWKRWTLWASLVLGVAVLGWMAIRLGRQMARAPDG